MFTGIIEEVGRISAIRDLGGGRRISVEAKMVPELHIDQSISINGACQTVVEVNSGRLDVIAVEETLRKTTFGSLNPGDLVNLERAMSPTGRLDGHIVQGHVDTTGSISAVEKQQTSWLFTIRFPESFSPYVIPVGSIAVEGISLTVARLGEHEFTVAIIPYTFDHTNVSEWKVGRKVNLEFDMIGKYVARWLSLRGGEQGITETWLRDRGY